MALLIPGFAEAFWESIYFLFQIEATNLNLPVPWPWRVDFASVSSRSAIRQVLLGLFFIGILVFGVLSVLWVFWRKSQNRPVSPALAAASFLALPYAHYAFSRADAPHLSFGIYPFLIGCLVFLAAQPAKVKWRLALLLCVLSLEVAHGYHPGWYCLKKDRCVDIEISGSRVAVNRSTAENVLLLRHFADEFAPAGRNFLAIPHWPGAYPLLERKSPTWEIYALFPRPPAFEQAEIERIKAARPGFVFVLDHALDGRDDLRFKNTHPLTHQYILENYQRLAVSPNPAYHIYKPKGEFRP